MTSTDDNIEQCCGSIIYWPPVSGSVNPELRIRFRILTIYERNLRKKFNIFKFKFLMIYLDVPTHLTTYFFQGPLIVQAGSKTDLWIRIRNSKIRICRSGTNIYGSTILDKRETIISSCRQAYLRNVTGQCSKKKVSAMLDTNPPDLNFKTHLGELVS